MHRCVTGFVLGLAAFAAAAAAQPVRTEGAVACAIEGYGSDRDPAGTNVRAAPHAGAAVIGRLPPMQEDEELSETVGPTISVIGSRDGWFLIRRAQPQPPAGGAAPPRPGFVGTGWVAANLVRFTMNGQALRASPRQGAQSVLALSGTSREGAFSADSVAIERVHGCQGAFAEVSVRRPDGRRARGWADRLCSNQVTTCP